MTHLPLPKCIPYIHVHLCKHTWFTYMHYTLHPGILGNCISIVTSINEYWFHTCVGSAGWHWALCTWTIQIRPLLWALGGSIALLAWPTPFLSSSCMYSFWEILMKSYGSHKLGDNNSFEQSPLVQWRINYINMCWVSRSIVILLCVFVCVCVCDNLLCKGGFVVCGLHSWLDIPSNQKWEERRKDVVFLGNSKHFIVLHVS